jgi:hypothetical protein
VRHLPLKAPNHGQSPHTSEYKPWELNTCPAFKDKIFFDKKIGKDQDEANEATTVFGIDLRKARHHEQYRHGTGVNGVIGIVIRSQFRCNLK